MRGGRLAIALAAAWAFVGPAACNGSRLPASLSDGEFWRLITELSEPAGAFVHSDNLVSNETHFPEMIRMLGRRSGAFIGVGPEQNFNYIAGLQPDIAFIVDIRRENWTLHLLYKALFELSADRVDFVGRLFSRPRPSALDRDSTPQAIVDAYEAVDAGDAIYASTVRLVRDRLVDGRRFALAAEDLASIQAILSAFRSAGLAIHYRQGDLAGPSYAALMTETDLVRSYRSYLRDEAAFAYIKDLHVRNLIVPLVGDFAGPRTVRAIGDYVRRHDGIVRVFYGSNVEVYLNREQSAQFCGTLAALPYDARSWFIGNKGMRPLRTKVAACADATR